MAPPKIIFTRHARDMLAERRLQREWIEQTITMPARVEPDPDRPNLCRAYRHIPERRGLWLRVVYEPMGDGVKLITAFFDRRQKG